MNGDIADGQEMSNTISQDVFAEIKIFIYADVKALGNRFLDKSNILATGDDARLSCKATQVTIISGDDARQLRQ